MQMHLTFNVKTQMFWNQTFDCIRSIVNPLTTDSIAEWDVTMAKKVCNDTLEKLATGLRTTAWAAKTREDMKQTIVKAITPNI